ncbi:MAG: N-acetylmuramoyl-L-alanine amidase [Bacteroidales bacterium]|nr:N-acetylmuramoyl-L-alanine amidase [Bacteroidales bacterium]
MTKNQKARIFLSALAFFMILLTPQKHIYAQETTNLVKKIVLDAGHGGRDPGALGKRTKEKNLTLAITLKLGKYIEEKMPGVEVVYTRTTDKFLELSERTDIALKENADVFISIHINSCKDKNVKGVCTYVTGLARSQENLELAMLENSVIKNEENYEAKYGDILNQTIDYESEYIASTLFQNAHHEQSICLAGYIQNQFRTRTGRKDLGVKQANFAVLWRATMPSVLVECGFISNPDEEKEMATDYWQSIIASAIFRAFRQYKEDLESGTLSSSQSQRAPKGEVSQKQPAPQPQPAAPQQPKNNNSGNNSKICLKVQLKSSTERIPTNSKIFKGIENVEEIKIDGVYKYTVGCEQDMQKILQIQSEVRKKIPDAFVIAVKGNQRLDINAAKKELGIK